jgi:hypothetical protein
MNEEPAASLLASLIEGNRTTTSKYTISKRSFFPAEREALVRIYEACGGEGWLRNGRWLTTKEPHTWHGVVVGDDGHVTRLFLRDNNLTGELPDIFSKLPKLQQIYLSGNELCGEIPVSIGGLSDLQTLDLSNNMFSGNLPRSVGGLFSLQRLLLSHNELGSELPNTLACLSNLRWIDYRENLDPEKPLPAFLDFIPVRRPQDPRKF